ncbi:MAG: PQQ-binding-like beta-propeller repeat protein [Candidatus Bathyarchaeota archaeon]|nr:PQQ-binding-like beta-propeller repeat protein [Candidatus Bathyarchaeum sp.]
MNNIQNKFKASTITLIALLTVSAMLVALPTTTAQTSTRTTYAFIGATPNPVGVNQEVLIHVGIPDYLSTAGDGWEGMSITVTRPDGENETLGPITTDATGGTGYVYTPTIVGTYYVQSHFPEQEYNGITYLASDSGTLELIVQEDPLEYYPGTSLPTEYWTRPINAQYWEWSALAGNWLEAAGGFTLPPVSKYIPYNEDAPETSHILWTKTLATGGLVGGELANVQYETGDAYEGFFSGTVIINGVLYYNRYNSDGGTNVVQEVVAVELKTGEELWCKVLGDNERLSFGQVFYWDSYNYHGAFDYLWTTSGTTWNAYDALTGRWEYSMTNVPSGSNLYGSKGEIYRYTVDLVNGWVTLWNSSRVVSDEGSWGSSAVGNTFDATLGIEWNKTIPTGLSGSVCEYFFEDKIIGATTGMFGTTAATVTYWAISMEPGQEGTILYNTTWTVPSGDLTLGYTDASAEDGVFILSAKENRKYYGFSLETGELLWETEPETQLALYDKWYGPAIAYGRFYTGRYSGVVNCYNITTGKLLWSYDTVDEYSENLWGNNWPIGFHFVTAGKVYVSYMEHSPINPNARGAPFFCLDAETGDLVWSITFAGSFWGGTAVIGDSTIAALNTYDQQIYAIGKGASSITLTASPKVSVHGSSVLLEGTVMDISPGTEDSAIAIRFPNGVPAVSDAVMSEWMEYVYQQAERPAGATGVTVTLEAVDPNNNYQNLGTTTSDSYGNYGFAFEPEVEGTYMIIATFGGSESYYGSTSTTYITVDPATSPSTPIEPDTETPDTETPDTEEPLTETEEPVTEASTIATETAIIAAVVIAAIIAAVGIFVIRKRK